MDLTESLRTDLVQHLSPKEALVVGSDSPIGQVIGLMQEKKEGCAIVCDESGSAVGVFTERDLLARVIGEQVSLDSVVGSVMSTPVASVRACDTVWRAVEIMHARALRHLPVVDDDGHLQGVVSVRRVLEYLVDHCPQAVYNQPPSAAQVSDREGA